MQDRAAKQGKLTTERAQERRLFTSPVGMTESDRKGISLYYAGEEKEKAFEGINGESMMKTE